MKFDNETIEKAKALRAKGLTYQAIGKEIGRSKNAIVGLFYRLKNPPKHPQSADFFWTGEQDDLLREAIANGETYKEAAWRLEKPMAAVQSRCYRLKIQYRAVTVGNLVVRKRQDLSKIKGKSMAEITNGQCRYPFGEGPYKFCGKKCTEIYCKAHDKICRPDKKDDTDSFVKNAEYWANR